MTPASIVEPNRLINQPININNYALHEYNWTSALPLLRSGKWLHVASKYIQISHRNCKCDVYHNNQWRMVPSTTYQAHSDSMSRIRHPLQSTHYPRVWGPRSDLAPSRIFVDVDFLLTTLHDRRRCWIRLHEIPSRWNEASSEASWYPHTERQRRYWSVLFGTIHTLLRNEFSLQLESLKYNPSLTLSKFTEECRYFTLPRLSDWFPKEVWRVFHH